MISSEMNMKTCYINIPNTTKAPTSKKMRTSGQYLTKSLILEAWYKIRTPTNGAILIRFLAKNLWSTIMLKRKIPSPNNMQLRRSRSKELIPRNVLTIKWLICRMKSKMTKTLTTRYLFLTISKLTVVSAKPSDWKVGQRCPKRKSILSSSSRNIRIQTRKLLIWSKNSAT